MQPVIAREEYEKLNNTSLRSVTVSSASFFAIIMFGILTLESAFLNGERADQVSKVLIGNLTSAVVSGLSFGLIFVVLARIFTSRITKNLYANSDNENSKQDADSTFFLPCSFVKSPRLAIGGTLYFGEEDIVFTPHKFNLRKHRDLSIRILHNEITDVRMVDPANGLLTKLLTCQVLPLVQVKTTENEYRFLTQKPEFVAEFVRGYVRKNVIN